MKNSVFVDLLGYGLSIVPTDSHKIPVLPSWQGLQSIKPNLSDLGRWPESHGVGVICGVVSGGLFCIDVDQKNDPTKKLMSEYADLIREQAPDLIKKMVIESTPSGGYHLIGRCTTKIRNTKLAKNTKHEVLIETRGEGGYFCAAPTPDYKFLSGGSLGKIPQIEPEELEILLDCARALNQEAKEPIRAAKPNSSGTKPLDDYDNKTPIEDTLVLLESHGWKIVSRRGDAFYLKRPDKTDRGISATLNHIPNRFYCFSSSTVFEAEHVYKPYAVYAMLEHGGNYNEAAKALVAKGYGEKQKKIEVKIGGPQEVTPEIKINIISKKDDITRDLLDLYDNGFKQGAYIGWPKLSKHYQAVKGQLNIFTGIPSHGKSEFTDALMVNLAGREAWNFVVYSPENYPVILHARKLIEKYAGKSMFGPNKLTREALLDGNKWVNSHFSFIAGTEEDVTLDSIFESILEEKKKKQIDGFLIDPWNELESTRPDKMTETDFVGLCLKRIRLFCRKHDLWGAVVAHPAKMRKDPKTGEYPIPTAYDISGSANWYNKADNIFIIHRDFINKIVKIIIQKIKFKYYGDVGEVEMRYILDSGRYEEMDAHANFTHNMQLPLGDRDED